MGTRLKQFKVVLSDLKLIQGNAKLFKVVLSDLNLC